jgi:hypothetical protein
MDKALAYNLYELFRKEMGECFRIHQESLQHYLAFASAILGATILGILQIQGWGWAGLVILSGPILNSFICVLGIRMCNRFYLGALERIALTAKLEQVLGLQEPILTPDRSDNIAFPGDGHFLPERWLAGRKYSTTTEFVKRNMKSGVNRLATWTFRALIAVNILLGVAIIVVTFK